MIMNLPMVARAVAIACLGLHLPLGLLLGLNLFVNGCQHSGSGNLRLALGLQEVPEVPVGNLDEITLVSHARNLLSKDDLLRLLHRALSDDTQRSASHGRSPDLSGGGGGGHGPEAFEAAEASHGVAVAVNSTMSPC